MSKLLLARKSSTYKRCLLLTKSVTHLQKVFPTSTKAKLSFFIKGGFLPLQRQNQRSPCQVSLQKNHTSSAFKTYIIIYIFLNSKIITIIPYNLSPTLYQIQIFKVHFFKLLDLYMFVFAFL